MSLIPGSERQPIRGARVVRDASPDQTIEVSVRLRPKSPAKHLELGKALEDTNFQQMSRRDFEAAHGADPADLAQIKKFAKECGLQVHETGTELARRTVVLSGTIANLQKAFNVELKEYKHPNGNYRGRTGPISVPAEYADIIQGVFGLDDRPQAEPHFRRMNQVWGLSHTPLRSPMIPTKWANCMISRWEMEPGSALGLLNLEVVTVSATLTLFPHTQHCRTPGHFSLCRQRNKQPQHTR